jgi:hypothetical protein
VFARGLGLKGQKGWKEWSKSGQRPSDIPTHPEKTYRDAGWISWPDWLGSERVAWKSFTEARAYVRGLGLKGVKEWWELSKSGQRPSDIPADPDRTYRDDGWVSWPDWLGNGNARVSWRSFTVGRVFVRGLELKGERGWKAWKKKGQRPSDIPSAPDKTYRDDGWISWPDWLGSGGTSNQARHVNMLPFAVGRAYARKLKLKNRPEWREWSKSGQRPSNIPATPQRSYHNDGWVSYSDWLGYGSEGGATAYPT